MRNPRPGSFVLAGLVGLLVMAGAASEAAAAARLSIRGAEILDPSGAPILLRGYDWNEHSLPQDAAENRAQGANMVRFTLGWRIDPSKACAAASGRSRFDAYAPGQPGNLDPRLLADADAKIARAGAQHLWVDLAIRGGDCDFWTDPAMPERFAAMWAFLAARYRNTPYVGAYELLSEPKPTGERTDNLKVKALYERVIRAIRAVDATTPIMIGPAPSYNIRNIDQIYIAGRHDLIYTANFYEPKAYVKETKGGRLGAGGYPGVYYDKGAGKTACRYEGKNQPEVRVDRAWLAGLLGCMTAFREARGAPVFVDQVGIRSGVPDAKAWTSDVLGVMNQDHIGWAYWLYRKQYSNGPGALLEGDIGVVWQDGAGGWRRKTDWLDLISRNMRLPAKAP